MALSFLLLLYWELYFGRKCVPKKDEGEGRGLLSAAADHGGGGENGGGNPVRQE